MTLLVFTKNFVIIEAIKSLIPEDGEVFFFDNRLELIVSATVLDKPRVLIDAIGERSDNISWIYYRLAAIELTGKTWFLSAVECAENNYLKNFNLITTLKELKIFCDHAHRPRIHEKPAKLNELLHRGLVRRISHQHIIFLLNRYDASKKHYSTRSKSDACKNHYLWNKLSLKSGLEMKQLILLLSQSRSH